MGRADVWGVPVVLFFAAPLSHPPVLAPEQLTMIKSSHTRPPPLPLALQLGYCISVPPPPKGRPAILLIPRIPHRSAPSIYAPASRPKATRRINISENIVSGERRRDFYLSIFHTCVF